MKTPKNPERPLANIFYDIKSGDMKQKDEAINELIYLWDSERLAIREPPMEIVDKLYKKACSKCGNDLIQPYNYCRFCGTALKIGGVNGTYNVR